MKKEISELVKNQFQNINIHSSNKELETMRDRKERVKY